MRLQTISIVRVMRALMTLCSVDMSVAQTVSPTQEQSRARESQQQVQECRGQVLDRLNGPRGNSTASRPNYRIRVMIRRIDIHAGAISRPGR
jgi:hypothetical protein